MGNKMVREEMMNPSSIILAVVPANTNLESQEILSICGSTVPDNRRILTHFNCRALPGVHYPTCITYPACITQRVLLSAAAA